MKVSTILLALLSVSAVAAQTQSQNQQATMTPVPTPASTTPALTTGKPTPPPEVTTAKPTTTEPPKPTPAPTTPVPTPVVTKPLRNCWDKNHWEMSVEHDATYCIDGPICSGSGAQPAGWNCPKKGDIAIADCYKYLKSWADAGKCVAPVDAECRVIKTGAWGCVWKGTPTDAPVTPAPTGQNSPTSTPMTTSTTKPTTSPTTTPWPTKPHGNDTTGSGSGKPIQPGNVTQDDDDETIKFPKQNATSLSASTESSTSNGSSAAMIGGIGAVAGIAAVVAAAAIYRRRRNNQAQDQEDAFDLETVVTTPTNHQ